MTTAKTDLQPEILAMVEYMHGLYRGFLAKGCTEDEAVKLASAMVSSAAQATRK